MVRECGGGSEVVLLACFAWVLLQCPVTDLVAFLGYVEWMERSSEWVVSPEHHLVGAWDQNLDHQRLLG